MNYIGANMIDLVKTGDIILIGIKVPEEYDGKTIEQMFKEFIEEPHGWAKTLEGIKGKESR